MNGQSAITLIDNKTLGDHHIFIYIILKSANMSLMMERGMNALNISSAHIPILWLNSCLVL